jgi:hypothetical protein
MRMVGQNCICMVFLAMVSPNIYGIYVIFGREITKHTVIYGAYIRFWPALMTWKHEAQMQAHKVVLLCCTKH